MRPSSGSARPAGAWAGVRFADREYAARLAALQDGLAREGLDAVVLTDDRLTWYYTGFGDSGPIGSPARPRVLIVARDDAAFVVHASTRTCVEEMSAVGDVRTYAELGALPVEPVLDVLRERDARVAGLELSGQLRPGATLADLDALRAGIPDVRDAASLLWRLRFVKSPAEVDRIREACAITADAFREGLPRVRAGLTEREVGELFDRLMRERGADDTWSWVASGRGQYHRVDGVARHRAIEPGELVFVDMGARVGGYWADFSRSAVAGRASAHQRERQATIAATTRAGVEAIRPGRTTGDVARVLDGALAAAGVSFSSGAGRYGHGLGLWTTEPPDLWRTDATPIVPGMVLTVEPGTVTDEGMFHCEDDVLVTADGVELLSDVPHELVEAA